ncbi:MAG: diadenylate cyclase CdaA [Acetobacteraceae bacterium]|nr:diadenylate cyclase CdaA [Acetobacteraceae bacterium]
MSAMLSGLGLMTPWEIVVAVVEVAIIAYLVYRLLLLVRGTRSVQLLNGLVVLLCATLVSQRLNLLAISWILEKLLVMLVVALPVVFQPELRRALEQLGRGRLVSRLFRAGPARGGSRLAVHVARAAAALSRSRTGAIIVLERQTGLQDVADTGVRLDAVVSPELLVTLFSPRSPLHDGAAVVRGDRVVAAGCFLPLAEAVEVDPDLGSRHRAALGVTEHSDAAAVVVSEETGAVSLAHAARLERGLDERSLCQRLYQLLGAPEEGPGPQQPEGGGPGGRADG